MALSEEQFDLDISVADTGPGISTEDQARIFQPFVQVGQRPHGAQKGTGLGLTISRQLAERMGGQLTVEPAPGRGSVFRLRVRLASGAEGSSACTGFPEDAERILVVGPEPEERRAIVEYAATLGYAADEAVSGSQAMLRLGQVDRTRWRAAILDEDLGAEELEVLVRAMRRHPSFADLRIWLLKKPTSPRPLCSAAVRIDANIGKPIRLSALKAAMIGRDLSNLAAEPDHPSRRFANRRYRVLVADDDRTSCMWAALVLRREGFEVHEAADGPQAMAALASQSFDAAILDLQMPGYGGLEVARKVRAQEMGTSTPALPMAAATAHVRPEDVELCREAGIRGFLPKPITAQRLVATVQALVSGGEPPPISLNGHAEAPSPPHGESASELPVLDETVLAASLTGDRPSQRRTLTVFLQDVPTLAKALLEPKNSMEEIIAKAHRLSGAARTVGAKRLGHAAAELERAAELADHDAMIPAAARVAAEVPAALAAGEALLSRGG